MELVALAVGILLFLLHKETVVFKVGAQVLEEAKKELHVTVCLSVKHLISHISCPYQKENDSCLTL